MAARKTTSPAKSEVENELDDDVVETTTFTYELNGHEFQLTCVADINEADPEAYFAYVEKNYPMMMKWLLGEFQYNMLRQAGLRTKHVFSLFRTWAEATGAGEE